jgi:hypothetical protein
VARTPKTKRSTRHDRSMAFCLRQFLTPQVWKQARRGLKGSRKDARWDFHHLILVTLAMTWSLGDSAPERFEMARGIVAICRPKRRRAGTTALGFQKALCRLPMRPLLALAGALRSRLLWLLGDGLLHGGFIPLGCDGSRLECCRNDELIARMGRAGKAGSSPTMWVTAVVHLTTGVPWSWWLGRGNASERDHLERLLPSLPKKALVITDAGYDGYDLAVAILASGASFLIRMSSKTHLFVDRLTDPESFSQGRVSYWPGRARQAKQKPLELRLIRVSRRRGKDPRRAVDVWLLTDVGAGRMSITQAGSFYRLRWENEGLFRSYKRTLSKVHLTGRTVRAVHREAYGSLLACQLLLAQGAWALLPGARDRAKAVVPSSPRQVLLEVRKELRAAMRSDRREGYRDRLARCQRERRERTSPKQKRAWPQRTPHKPPKPPRLLTMNQEQKALLSSLNAVA